MIETVFLDAGGVLVNPNWDRVAATLAHHGVASPPPPWKRRSRTRRSSSTTGQAIRTPTTARAAALLQPRAAARGIALFSGHEAALRELAAYHAQNTSVRVCRATSRTPSTACARPASPGRGIQCERHGAQHFARLDLARHFDVLIDSQDEAWRSRTRASSTSRSSARRARRRRCARRDFHHVTSWERARRLQPGPSRRRPLRRPRRDPSALPGRDGRSSLTA